MSHFTVDMLLGGLVVLSARIPLFVRRIQLSLPMVAVGMGARLPH